MFVRKGASVRLGGLLGDALAHAAGLLGGVQFGEDEPEVGWVRARVGGLTR